MTSSTYTKTWHNASYDAISPTKPELSVAGKVVFVSGGGYGIGRAIVRAFADAGAKDIAIIGRNESPLRTVKSDIEESTKTKIHVFVGDVADEVAVNGVFKSIRQTIGPIDILVANAGFLPEPKLVAESSIDDWWRGFEVNFKGGIILAKAFLHAAATDGVFINVSASLAHAGTFPTLSAYGASKLAFVRALDFVQEENPHIRVVSSRPGCIDTDMNRKSGITNVPYDHGEGSIHLCIAFC
jgi:NAD(P)-dependent dehydrogenase (short-subunit alcohol dehydrogenase family)